MSVKVGRKPKRHGVRKGDPVKPLMERKGVTCPCWTCLRKAGITPNKHYLSYHKDIFGNEYNNSNGQVKVRAKQEEVKAGASDNGLRKEAT